MRKRIFWLMTVVALCTCLFAVNVSAAKRVASGRCGNNIMWTLYNDGELVISGKGDMPSWEYSADSPWYNRRGSVKKVTVQSGVTSISPCAFFGCEVMTSASIADSVTSIGENAFINCRALTSVDFGSGVTEIGKNAFNCCKLLTDIVLPDTLESIGESAFYDCDSLTEIVLPDSVINVGGSAFGNCDALLSVTIGSGVTEIGDRAFALCGNLTEICTADSANYLSADGVLFNKEQTTLIQYPAGKSGAYTVPDGVECIGDWAFSYSTLSGVIMPESVKTIGNSAFYSCGSLTDVSFGGVTSIGDFAFYKCDSLAEITVPAGVTEIGDCAFYECDLLTSASVLTKTASFGVDVFDSTVTVSAPVGSTAQTYANANAYAFTAMRNPVVGIVIGICAAVGIAAVVCIALAVRKKADKN